MKKPKNISTEKLFKKNNKYKIKLDIEKAKENLLRKDFQKNTLSSSRTFSLNSIKINNKESIEIKEMKKRKALSPKSKVKIIENQIKKIKEGKLFNLKKKMPSLQKEKRILKKKINDLNNDINNIKRINKYRSLNKFYVMEKDNEKIKNILKNEEKISINIKRQIDDDDNSLNFLRIRINKEYKEANRNIDNIHKIEDQIMELKKEIEKINDKNNKLIKEKENIINELKEYKKKNDDLKNNINKYENSSNNFLNDVEKLMKLYN